MDFEEAIAKRAKFYENPPHSLPESQAEGKAFEDLCKFYLENGPWGKQKGEMKVYRWADPGNPLTLNASSEKDRSPQDTGCDLVVCAAGETYAVQCKYYPKSPLTQNGAHLANVFGIANRYGIDSRHVIFCYIAESVSSQAENMLSRCTCIRENDLENPDFDWGPMFGEKKRTPKELRPYQKKAVIKCIQGFKKEEEGGEAQVGKLIMACGTGKTLTSLALAKELSKGGPYNVLFLAPSIALVSQTFQAWSIEEDISSLIVCSDSTAGRGKEDDGEEIDESIADIASPDVTTDAEEMAEKWKKLRGGYPLRVVFSTYQSIETVKEFQDKSGVKFDLTICDEAHRTASHEGSLFSKAAEPGYINTSKKLFMTATPKIYAEGVKSRAQEEYSLILYSMDDKRYGPEFYRFSFGEAVDEGWLCDYRVLILGITAGAEATDSQKEIESLISNLDIAKEEREKLEKAFNRARSESTKSKAEKKRQNFEKKLQTLAGKCFGAYIDLSDLNASAQGEVAEDFGGSVQYKTAEDGKALTKGLFAHSAIGFANSIQNSKLIQRAFSSPAFPGKDPGIECRHIDGNMKSDDRIRDLLWLKQGQKTGGIRIITNAQCLSEGIDVPSLDAVVFFEKRQSQIGIIQAVGRVMRKAHGKKYGYIILPIIVPDSNPEYTLENSDEWGAIMQVLQSMRSVDERLDAKINALALAKEIKKKGKKKGAGETPRKAPSQPSLFDERMQKELVSVILSKCGSSMYWDDWVGQISGSVQNMINDIEGQTDTPKFDDFLKSLANTLHKEQSKKDAVNLITQFIVTRPVFSILFPQSDFDSNPVSKALESIADDFKEAYSAYDRELGAFRFAIEQAAKAVSKNPAARKRLVKTFYEKFYRKVFAKEAKTNGIVYTPEPVVDFMIKETDRLLEANFQKRLQDEGIQILDPFSGTGTFVTRLLDKDMGVINDEHLERKYEKEIWANEIMLTAYYISTLNIEDAAGERLGKPKPFPGAVLTDTFRISEAKHMIPGDGFSDNNIRENSEEEKKISVIISNPPYSAKQDSANENNAHLRYKDLDDKIRSTYVKRGSAIKQTFDSYKRAFRWASDRIGDRGIISFITNSNWLKGRGEEGVRRSFMEEFNDIYVYDLRGDSNYGGIEEGKNIFDIKIPVAITFLVRNPKSKYMGKIHYIQTPDFASKETKFSLLEEAKEREPEWEDLHSDDFGDWLEQRDGSYYSLIPMGIAGRKNKQDSGIFSIWSEGLVTGRDPWIYSFTKDDLIKNIGRFEDFFNTELERWNKAGRSGKPENFVKYDPTKIKWGREVFDLFNRTSSPLKVDRSHIREVMSRPFVKKYLYFYKPLIAQTYKQISLFPLQDSFNLEICVLAGADLSCLMACILPNFGLFGFSHGCQAFPLYRYQKNNFQGSYEKRSAITDKALKIFRKVYGDTLDIDPDKAKEQIFYYIYGLLHSKEYREKWQNNLAKENPRIPFSAHFEDFEQAGRRLSHLHTDYENVKKSEEVVKIGEAVGEISKMKLDKDEGTLFVNENLSFKNIPGGAFKYLLNGRSPLEWAVNQYKKTVDKESLIVSDPNNSPIAGISYLFDLVPRLVTVSCETCRIAGSLPSIDRLASMDSEIRSIWGNEEIR